LERRTPLVATTLERPDTHPGMPDRAGYRVRMARRTKIVATIGPASDSEDTLKAMIAAGMDVARIGLAHDGLDVTLERFRRIRVASAALDREVGILVDLPGPKVRAGRFPDQGVMLDEGSIIRMVPGSEASTAKVVPVDYDELIADIHHGDTLGFGDGAVVVEVIGNTGDALEVRVIHGGVVAGRPGVHIPSDRLRIPTPTPQDLVMLDAFIEAGVDMVAVSFVRSAHDVRRVGVEPHPRGPLVVAKIETRAAVDNLDGIIEASGGVMVARGDLGMEFPIEELPHLQKQIIQRCIALGRPTITATQMLESMVHAPTPTRAEASDVANAVFDGSSALMLSGETAMGSDPVNAVATMARIAARADQRFDYGGWARDLAESHMTSVTDTDDAITDAMSMAGWRAALETKAEAIVCLTTTGFTVRSIARFRPEARILAFSPDERTVRQLSLSWGARAYRIEALPIDEMIPRALEIIRSRGEVRSGDLVAVLAGSPEYQGRAADTLRLMRVP
jgi:pyruvate kinase